MLPALSDRALAALLVLCEFGCLTVLGIMLVQIMHWESIVNLPTPAEPQALYAQAACFYGTAWAKSGSGAGNASGHASLISWDNPALVASACYWVPQKGLVLRLLNPTDAPVSAALQPGFKYRSIHCVNFLEEPVSTITAPNVTIAPRDVQTLLFAV